MNQCFTYSISPSISFFAEIHTFSAKEKDTETGLSYFGSRYYSSDLSIWLSVDPMSDKYPSLSPYTYCANNPVKLVDPNGEEIVISEYTNQEGKTVYDIKFTARMIDRTGKKYDEKTMQQYKDAIKQAIENQYGGEKDDGSVVNVDVDIEINGENDGSRHSIYLVNKCSKPGLAGEAEEGGKYMNINMNEVDVKGNTNTIGRTAGHEFGHLLRLQHSDETSNLMNPNTEGTNVTGLQVKQAYQNYSHNNINVGILRYDYKRRKSHETLLKITGGKQ